MTTARTNALPDSDTLSSSPSPQPSIRNYIVIMRPTSMKVPPLGQLYQQKVSYEMHRKKIDKIMADRKSTSVHSLLRDQRYSQHFQRNYNTKSLQIAKENTKILQKIRTAKPSYSFKETGNRSREIRLSQSTNDRKRVVEQERQNYRIKNRVKSMSSELRKENMARDYNRSNQIKNRLMHFKREGSNKVVLKASRYLGSSNYKAESNMASNSRLRKDSLKNITHNNNLDRQQRNSYNLNKDLINLRMKRVGGNVAKYYKKDEIIKNKIANTNKLFQATRQKRSKALSMMQKGVPSQPQNQESNILFPTQPSRRIK